jgi:hypothetical protein
MTNEYKPLSATSNSDAFSLSIKRFCTNIRATDEISFNILRAVAIPIRSRFRSTSVSAEREMLASYPALAVIGISLFGAAVTLGLSRWERLNSTGPGCDGGLGGLGLDIHACLDNPPPNIPTWHLGVESQMPWADIQHARKRVRCQESPDVAAAWAAFDLPVP